MYLPTCFIYVILPPYLLTTSYIFTHGIGLSNPQPTHAPTTRLRPRQAAKGKRGGAVGGGGGWRGKCDPRARPRPELASYACMGLADLLGWLSSFFLLRVVGGW